MAGLTRKQDEAIVALLMMSTIAEASKRVGVGERTLFRWLQRDTAFQAAYREARRQAVQQAIARIQRATSTAVTTLEAVMRDPDKPSSSRVSAARVVLEMALKAIEFEDLEWRVAALETALQQGRNGHGP
jgi:alpha-beta hydrolase superfamily lysophospholipase